MSETKKVETKKKERLKENIMGYSFLAPALLLLFIFLVIPVGMVILLCLYRLLPIDTRGQKICRATKFQCV